MSVTGEKDWERQRAVLMHAAFERAEKMIRIERATVKAALAKARASLAGTILSNGKYLRCSDPTIRRAWDCWNGGGRSPDAVVREFAGRAVDVPAKLVREFQRRCTTEGVLNISAAIKSLHRDWRHNDPIDGLGTREDWCLAKGLPLDAQPDFPFSTRTLYRWKPSDTERAGGVFGRARQRAVGPHVDMDYSKLRKCELYVLDDVRLDILVVDENTGRVVEVTCYMLMEASSRYIVAWVLKPANAIKQEDVDELLAYGLQVEGFGIGIDYPTHIKFERGTIACSDAAQKLLEGVSEGMLLMHRSSMDGGIRWIGAPADKAAGHAAGKAIIESFFRRLHIALMMLPGQRGNHYGNQPQDLGYEGEDKLAPRSLAAEAEKLATLQHRLGKRVKLRLDMLYVRQLRDAFKSAIHEHNHSPGHEYSGHGTFTQAEVAPGVWQETAQ